MTIARIIEPMKDGTLFKEITPQGYVEGPIMFMPAASSTSCGAKAMGTKRRVVGAIMNFKTFADLVESFDTPMDPTSKIA